MDSVLDEEDGLDDELLDPNSDEGSTRDDESDAESIISDLDDLPGHDDLVDLPDAYISNEEDNLPAPSEDTEESKSNISIL